MPVLPILGTIADAYRFIATNRRDFIALAYLPVLLTALVQVALFLPFGDVFTTALQPPQGDPTPEELTAYATSFLALMAIVLMMLLASLAIYTPFGVAWHRLFLRGPEGGTIGQALRWRQRHSRFLGRVLSLVVLVMLLSGLLGAVVAGAAGGIAGGGGRFVAAMLLAYFLVALGLVRLLLVLPATAVGDVGVNFGEAWQMTRRNTWRLLLALFAGAIPVVALESIFERALTAAFDIDTVYGSLPLFFALALIQQAFNYVGFAVITTVLSIAYRDLKAAPPPATTFT